MPRSLVLERLFNEIENAQLRKQDLIFRPGEDQTVNRLMISLKRAGLMRKFRTYQDEQGGYIKVPHNRLDALHDDVKLLLDAFRAASTLRNAEIPSYRDQEAAVFRQMDEFIKVEERKKRAASPDDEKDRGDDIEVSIPAIKIRIRLPSRQREIAATLEDESIALMALISLSSRVHLFSDRLSSAANEDNEARQMDVDTAPSLSPSNRG